MDRRTKTHGIRPLGGRTGAALLNFYRAPTPELIRVRREASSLSRQLQAALANFPQRVCRTLGVATPHKGEHKKRENGF